MKHRRKRKTYTPLYEDKVQVLDLKEAFKAGTNVKVMTLLGKILKNRTGMILDIDIPDGYENNLGKFRAFTGYLKDGRELRFNFLLSKSDDLYSVDKFNRDGLKPIETIVFDKDEDSNIVQKINTIIDFINNQFEENQQFCFEKILTEASRRKSAKGNLVKDWVLQPDHKKEREAMIQKEKFSVIYAEFIKTTPRDAKIPSQGTFSKFIKEYLKDNNMTNPHIRARAKKEKPSIDIPITLPEEKPLIANHKPVIIAANDWRVAFEDLQDQFDELMADRKFSPYGQIVWGNGGTGKSYYYNEMEGRYDMAIYKGAPSTAELVKILYKERDRAVIVFDDADKVVLDKNNANILKGATDDTVGEKHDGIRYVYPPKITDQVKKDFVLDGPNGTSFEFKASVVIITNLTKVADQALWTRLYKAPIFLTKHDIVEKIFETTDPTVFGCSKDQGMEVAEFMATLIESDQFTITNEQLSYRVYKRGLKFIKNYPARWKGKLMREFGIGIRTSLKGVENE